jgi:L-serine dehydratase
LRAPCQPRSSLACRSRRACCPPDQAAVKGGDRLDAGDGRQGASDRAIGLLSACALAASEENARGHLVITAPTGGSAGRPAVVYGLTEGKRKVTPDKLREGLLAGLAIGYLCKHNATLAAAEGGCPVEEIGVARRWPRPACAGDRGFAAGHRERRQIGAGAPSRHDLHPVAGYAQVPCIERCAFGAVKAWTAVMIATNEIASRHRVDLDTTIKTLADTGRT